jgi:hypothetical protein
LAASYEADKDKKWDQDIDKQSYVTEKGENNEEVKIMESKK